MYRRTEDEPINCRMKSEGHHIKKTYHFFSWNLKLDLEEG